MSFDLNGLDAVGAYRAVAREPVVAGAPGETGRFTHAARVDRADTIPASPPPELREEMLVAQRAFDEMRARGRELHFEMADGRVRIEMRDLEGNVLKQIPATEALEIASGRIPE
jgi:hypothetical protein